MELLGNKQPNINFVGQARTAAIISALLIVVAIGSLAVRGLNFGLDFTGGTLIDAAFEEPVAIPAIREGLRDSGLPDAVVQTYGSPSDITVRLAPEEGESSAELSERVIDVLELVSDDPVDIRRVDFVGPRFGQELANDGGLAILFALGAIVLYIVIRFTWKFSVGAVLALIHDVLIVLGIFSLFAFDFDLTILAAMLAVIGYSLNDTIVVYDRVRENLRTQRKMAPRDIFNLSINQMLSRTLMTSLTTLLVLGALFFLGGESINGFAMALIFGVIVGTYSSIYVAGTMLLLLGVRKQDLMAPPKEGATDRAP